MILGSKHSEASRKKISEAGIGRIPWNKNKVGYILLKSRGRKHTPETKIKMSNSHKGKIPWNMGLTYKLKEPFSMERKIKISKALTGKKLSEEHRESLRISHIGQKAWNKGVSGVFLGEKSNNWKGGKTTIRRLLPSLLQYKNWRLKVFERDNYTCQKCYKRGRDLEAHHIKKLSKIIDEYKLKTSKDCINCDELWNTNNGITLCKKCHKLIRGQEEYLRKNNFWKIKSTKSEPDKK